jgi:hypothetical protein
MVRGQQFDYSTLPLRVVNRDGYIGRLKIFTKEQLQAMYISKIGKHIKFKGVLKFVRDVAIADDYIYILVN